ncbi:hypothetical protein HOY80DRAFT_426294 [Tuber brumale]|nr:hypothetical protein HOY80DRAFT_426294 [Tuber brumale]
MIGRFEFVPVGNLLCSTKAKCNLELWTSIFSHVSEISVLAHHSCGSKKVFLLSNLPANTSTTTIMGSTKTKRKAAGDKSAKRKRRKKARTEVSSSSESNSSSSESENEAVRKPVETRAEEEEKAEEAPMIVEDSDSDAEVDTAAKFSKVPSPVTPSPSHQIPPIKTDEGGTPN